MLEIGYAGQFKKDYKTCKKRGYDMNLLQNVIDILAVPDQLPAKNKDHDLKGDFIGKRECHILPDWLLIYRIEGKTLMLYRTGTHSDLFRF